MQKIKKHKGLLLSLILAIVTVLVIQQYIASLEKTYGAGTAEEGGEMEYEQVVIAAQDLAPGTVIRAEHLSYKEVPANNIHSDAITDMDAVTGEVATQEMVADEVILAARVLAEEETDQLSYSIPTDKRALSVSVDEVSGVAGFIQAGDKVDVVAHLPVEAVTEEGEIMEDEVTEIILEELEILAVGDRMIYSEQELVQEVATVTLAASPENSTELVRADETGDIRLLLRSKVDQANGGE